MWAEFGGLHSLSAWWKYKAAMEATSALIVHAGSVHSTACATVDFFLPLSNTECSMQAIQ